MLIADLFIKWVPGRPIAMHQVWFTGSLQSSSSSSIAILSLNAVWVGDRLTPKLMLYFID